MKHLALSLLWLSSIITCNAHDDFGGNLQQERENQLQEAARQKKELINQQAYHYPHLILIQHIITDLSTDLQHATQSLSSLMENEHAQKDMLLLSTCYSNIAVGQSLSYSRHNNISFFGKDLEKESRDLITAIMNHSKALYKDEKPYELYTPADTQQFKKYKEALSNR